MARYVSGLVPVSASTSASSRDRTTWAWPTAWPSATTGRIASWISVIIVFPSLTPRRSPPALCDTQPPRQLPLVTVGHVVDVPLTTFLGGRCAIHHVC